VGTSEKTRLKIYELSRGEALPYNREKLQPNRVYLQKDEKEKSWAYALTDTRGRFPDPQEHFAPESVVPGPLLGGLYPKENYRLKDGKWIRSEDPQKMILVVLTNPPRSKLISFKQSK